GADLLQDWAQFAAPTTFSLAARAYSSLKLVERHPVLHNLVISNVPGPPIPLYFAGAKLVGLYPLGPIMDGAGLNITVLSYMDTMDWGLIACRELMPNLWALAAAVPDALAELVKAADADAAERNPESPTAGRAGRGGTKKARAKKPRGKATSSRAKAARAKPSRTKASRTKAGG
ncbi:MAG: WS/DGAT domain-containing protein, partial [Actinomycetota bacterium]